MKAIIIIIFLLVFFTLIAVDFHFAILGDRTGGADQEAFDQVIIEINRLHPDFVVTVGDLVEDGRLISDWDIPLKSLENLSCPIYFTPGNHDILDQDSAKLFYQKTGFPPYYSFDWENTHFTIMNNSTANAFENLEKEQIDWLIKDLALNFEKTNLFVFMHKPFWADGIAEAKPDSLHSLFMTYGVDAVFTGHWHQYAYDVFDGIEYYLVGSSGGGFGEENIDLGMFYQYLWCKIEEDKLYSSLIKSGNIYPQDFVNIKEEKLSYAIPRKLITTTTIDITDNKYTQELKIVNQTDNTIQEWLDLMVPENWKTSPEKFFVALEPDQSFIKKIYFDLVDNYYPLPQLVFNYPVGRGKYYNYNSPLNMARVINSVKVRTAPTIDGVFDEKEWIHGFIIKSLGNEKGTKAATNPSKFYFCHDHNNLYIGAVLTGRDLTYQERDHDSKVYEDESCGLLLSPDKNLYFIYYINPAGSVWDMRTDLNQESYDQDWNGEITAAVSVSDREWVFELKVPFEQLELPDKNKEIYLNFRRYQPDINESGLFIPTWSYNSANSGIIKLD